MLAEGIGEILTPITLCPGWMTLIAKPDVSVSTAHVYKTYRPEGIVHPDIDRIAEGIEKGDFDTVTRYMGNVLESVTVSEVPFIGKIKSIMAEQGGFPLMSGSGPTVFGLFGSEEEIKGAYDRLKQTEHISDLFITRIFDGRTQTANEHG